MSSQSNRTQVIKIFLSCADEDRGFLHMIERQLSSLVREGRIEIWHKYNTSLGVKWKEKAKEYLTVADIILLLVSQHFVASDYYYGEEALEAMAQYKKRNACVIPVIVRPTEWKNLIFSELRCLPIEGKAVSMWQRKEEALSDIVQGVRDTVEELALKLRPTSKAPADPFWNVPHWRNPFFCDLAAQPRTA